MTRKKKLEASLESLFSIPNRQIKSQEQTASGDEETEMAVVGAEKIAQPLITQKPEAATPSAGAEGATGNKRPAGSSPQAKDRVNSQNGRATTPSPETHLVIFALEDEHYGIDIAAVESIIKTQFITLVPHAPLFVEGVTNLRGTVLPVIDLHARFGLSRTEGTKDTRIIVVENDGTTVGMIVDAVTEVLRVPEEIIEPPSPMLVTVDPAFISGIAKLEQRLVTLLDLGKILSIEEKTQSPQLASTAA